MSRANDVASRIGDVRARSVGWCAPLSAEDAGAQSMPDASPAKWHLAHTTWFFETFVLARLAGAPPVDPGFAFLFNSYYEGVGERVERSRRGLLTRPSLDAIHTYRRDIDDRLARALAEHALDHEALIALELGLHHEQQHQELILTDLKHLLGSHPLRPAYRSDLRRTPSTIPPIPIRWLGFDGGQLSIGADDRGFAFDNERPRHALLVSPFRLASRPIANAEVLAFIADGGYREPRLWLSDGWQAVRTGGWEAPLYWQRRDDSWALYDFVGVRDVDPAETACHLSYYEADAIARWAGARLPTEAEWEIAGDAARLDDGHFADDERLHPRAAVGHGLTQVFGDVWEWTASAHAPYPGFRPLPGALGEYNGKFMCSQQVLRGGSCLTPRGHVRATYRNFFAPSTRWQMSGARLATAA